MSVRTRFAPSPTGYLHVGGARTALFNYLFARKHGGSFVLRVEDTDEARNTQEARDAIFSGMKWLGLEWDEGEGKGGDFGPYNQSERRENYDRWFEVLRAKGRVYEDEGAWRFRFERKPVTMQDLVCGEVTIDYRDESNTPDMVIRRSDGSYVFHFVNVVDDLEMQISHVIRGEDHLMNTPKHLQLFEALGAPAPHYAHIPLILNPNGSKMSKRDLGAAIGDYPKQGFIAEAVVNFIALLGWSPKSEDEIFTLEELVERFSLEAVNRSPARFDPEKCAWVNQQHLLKLAPDAFAEAAKPFVAQAGLPVDGGYPAVAALVREKVRLLSEVPSAIGFLLVDAFDFDPEAVEKVKGNAAAKGLLAALADDFAGLSEWSVDAAKHQIGETAKAAGAKAGQLMFPVRVALSGKSGGPDLGDILGLLGREKCVARLKRFLESL
ncbi:MAG: glutamate--tRNA ligase [Verrucomicrobia bacterium]|nr:MAG: glutamate--tRNA ligase [Verrucomicrobiota bacterium]TAE87047.1 MAG: glutamate--tRNA ligase [Verrucomicrobiota bacterium]TAF24846.1 MAG: glutamate--tRNA ligase [Verrucomicrobiota bacterium]TAF40596.1 MAG: glutamate--tRNA ligase [Verrucomicrobiota bacterium]